MVVIIRCYYIAAVASNLLLIVRYNGLYLARCCLPDGALDQLLEQLRTANVRTAPCDQKDRDSCWALAG